MARWKVVIKPVDENKEAGAVKLELWIIENMLKEQDGVLLTINMVIFLTLFIEAATGTKAIEIVTEAFATLSKYAEVDLSEEYGMTLQGKMTGT